MKIMNDFKFGNYLTELRKAKGYTQYELGKLLGVSDKAVSKWENGKAKPSTSILLNLSKILNVSLEELLQCSTETSNNIFEFNTFVFLNEIEIKLKNKYGNELPIEIWNLFLEEKSVLKNEPYVCYMLKNLYEIGNALNSNDIPFALNIMFSGSLIVNILGLCDVNPLKPHYYCPHCKKIEYVKDVKDGWDLEDKVCSCNNMFIKDGHDIPFLTYKDSFSNIANYYIFIAKHHIDKAKQIVEKQFSNINHIACLSGISNFNYKFIDIRLGCFGVKSIIDHIKYPMNYDEFNKKVRSKEKDKYVDYLEDCFSIVLLENPYFNKILNMNIDTKTANYLSSSNISKLVSNIKKITRNKILSQIIDVINPITINECIKCVNLIYSDFEKSYYSDLLLSLKNNKIELYDVITCREDLFSILIKKFNYNDFNEVANLITNEIRKGRKFSKYGNLINEKLFEMDEVFKEVNNFDKVKYLTSKSYSIILFKLMLYIIN